MIRVNLEGKVYWAGSNQLAQNTFQHPPFEDDLKQRILKNGKMVLEETKTLKMKLLSWNT